MIHLHQLEHHPRNYGIRWVSTYNILQLELQPHLLALTKSATATSPQWPHPTVLSRVSWGSASITFSSPVIFWTVTEIFAMAMTRRPRPRASPKRLSSGDDFTRDPCVRTSGVRVVSGAFDFLIFLDIATIPPFFRSDAIHWLPKSIPLIYTSMILHVIRKDLTDVGWPPDPCGPF